MSKKKVEERYNNRGQFNKKRKRDTIKIKGNDKKRKKNSKRQ